MRFTASKRADSVNRRAGCKNSSRIAWRETALAKDPRQIPLAFLPHKVQGRLVEQRSRDGYINATAMCRAANRPWSRYWDVRASKDFVEELSAALGIPITELIQSVSGGVPERQGTWVHPQVAVHLGQWLSPRFAVLVSKWVYEWMSSGASPAAARLPFHVRRYVANQRNVPVGHFSVLTEITLGLIGPMEAGGYTLPESMWPDISEGRIFARWLRDAKGVDTDDMPTYSHEFEDGRRSCQAKAYPNAWLAEFRRHFLEEWLPKHGPRYFSERDPAALPYLTPLLPSPDDGESRS